MTATEEFLEHYGVKGMKWGVRKKKVAPPPSPDARRRAKIQDKANKQGLDALTNAQMQIAIERMNLEVNYSRLNEQTRKKGKMESAVQFLIKDVAEVEVKRVVKQQSTIAVNNAMENAKNKQANKTAKV